MSKNDKYTVELDDGVWFIRCDGQKVSASVQKMRGPFISTTYLSFLDGAVAEDFCWMLNRAFAERMAKDAAEREQDHEECQTHVWLFDSSDGGMFCENCGAKRGASLIETKAAYARMQEEATAGQKPVFIPVCQHDWGKNLICAKCGADGTQGG